MYLGSVKVTIGADGSFTFAANTPVAVGQVVTATATDANGNSSEFTRDVQVAASAPPLHIADHIVGPVDNPFKPTYAETVTLTNVGTSTTPTFRFVLEGLTPGVTLTNASGATGDGSPYFAIGPLMAGQSITLTLTFTKTPSSLDIYFTPVFI